MSAVHNTQVNEVEVKDGTLPPSHEAKQNARAASDYRPHEKGHKHAIGPVRTTTRFAWFCSCGKSSNGCTYPNEQSAKSAGYQHRDAANLRLSSAV